jgi:glycosyltransferase involved in cell wall biosynthesis
MPQFPKKSIYIFLLTTNKPPFNKYVVYLAEALSKDFDVVNIRQKKNIGVLDFFKYFNSDMYILNWPENIYKLKYGRIQFLLYLLWAVLAKCFNKKIIWILHNKHPHTGPNFFSKISMWLTAFISTHVVTHSKEGVEFYKRKFNKNNIEYFPHPIYPDSTFHTANIKYDFIIWGKIAPYKNILRFIKYFNSSDEMKNKTLLICGESDKAYADEIENNITNNITFINKYLSIEELNKLISSAKVVLFTYDSESVLSSGALAYSLPSKKLIIGPKIGSFNDYADQNLITTFIDFAEIPHLLNSFTLNNTALENHIAENSWGGFSSKLSKLL